MTTVTVTQLLAQCWVVFLGIPSLQHQHSELVGHKPILKVTTNQSTGALCNTHHDIERQSMGCGIQGPVDR